MPLEASDKARFSAEYERIAMLAVSGDKATAVREGGRLCEEICKELFTDYLPQVDFVTRRFVVEKEVLIGKGTKGIKDFTFGQILGLLRESNFLDAIEKIEQRSTTLLKNINLDYICDLRNDSVHRGAEFEVQEYDVQYVVSSLKLWLLYFGIAVKEPKSQTAPRTIHELTDMMEDTFSSVEVIEGIQQFYRRLKELVEEPDIDTFDFTYLVENPPIHTRSGNDARFEYFKVVRDKVLNGDGKLRRIVNFNSPSKAAWILFNLVGSHQDLYGTEFKLAHFEVSKGNDTSVVMIPNLTLFYSSRDLANGYAWIYSLQEDDNQHFICLTGKAAFPTMRRLYANWYKSCESLSEERAKDAYIKWFGKPESTDDVEATANKFKDSVGLDTDGLNGSVKYWCKVLGVLKAE